MLVIEAIGVHGEPLSDPLRATFDASGGTIGRACASTLVLPDPERRISRTHATIGFDSRGFVLTDTGSYNRLALNGRALRGAHACLKDGDQLTVGPYRLLVHLRAAAPATVPQQSRPAPAIDEPPATIPAAPSNPLSDPPAGASQAASAEGAIAPEQQPCRPATDTEREDTLVAVQEHLASTTAKEMDLIFASRDARVEPCLHDDWMIKRPVLPMSSQEQDAFGLYPCIPVDSTLEPMPEIDGCDQATPLPRGEPPVLTSVWDPDEERAATTEPYSADVPARPAISASRLDPTVQQLEAILRAAGMSEITPARLEKIARVLRDCAQAAPERSRRSQVNAEDPPREPNARRSLIPVRHTRMLASVRGAVGDVMVRLSAQRLEGWLKRKSPLQSLLPTSH